MVAERYNVTKATVRKWRDREDMQDRSHRPNTLSTTLTPAQEALVVELRRTLLLPPDDLLALTHEFINRAASRSGLDRCLRRHGVNNLQSLIPVAEGKAVPTKTFKDYGPGFLHVDIKYLPQMPDETHRRYLYVAIVVRSARARHVAASALRGSRQTGADTRGPGARPGC